MVRTPSGQNQPSVRDSDERKHWRVLSLQWPILTTKEAALDLHGTELSTKAMLRWITVSWGDNIRQPGDWLARPTLARWYRRCLTSGVIRLPSPACLLSDIECLQGLTF